MVKPGVSLPSCRCGPTAWETPIARGRQPDPRAGTPIQELQELGGWESVEMVRRYAHLAPEHLERAAARILPLGTKLAAVAETASEKTA
jgi:hypothetical protein